MFLFLLLPLLFLLFLFHLGVGFFWEARYWEQRKTKRGGGGSKSSLVSLRRTTFTLLFLPVFLFSTLWKGKENICFSRAAKRRRRRRRSRKGTTTTTTTAEKCNLSRYARRTRSRRFQDVERTIVWNRKRARYSSISK